MITTKLIINYLYCMSTSHGSGSTGARYCTNTEKPIVPVPEN